MKHLLLLKEKYLSLNKKEKEEKILWILHLYIIETKKEIFQEIYNLVKNKNLDESYINEIIEIILDELYKYKNSQIQKLEDIHITLEKMKEQEKQEKEEENYESILNLMN